MKKAISILLVVAIAASLCMTAFAANVTTITRKCENCGKTALHYKSEVESLDRVVECPTHGGHDAERLYVYYAYECFKCTYYWVDYSTLVEIRYTCLP